ncbi:uncharacterized protein METZ01_LOCUS299316, partial [marine metagenome]
RMFGQERRKVALPSRAVILAAARTPRRRLIRRFAPSGICLRR